jgi:hypothetical protein
MNAVLLRYIEPSLKVRLDCKDIKRISDNVIVLAKVLMVVN